MARSGCGLKQATLDIEREMTIEECQAVERRSEFQEVLREEEDKYRVGIADRPSRSKSVAIGILVDSIEKLHKQGDYDKAAAAIEKLAKLEGWIGNDSNVNIMLGVTAKDIEAQKKRILEEIEQSRESAKEVLSN